MSLLTAPFETTRSISPSLARVLTVAALAIFAAIWHSLTFSNTDISWLLTVGEHILDGAKPYADIIETNPPGSVLLYVPAVLLGRALGITPEIVVVLLTCAAALASLAVSAALLRGMPGFGRMAPLLGAGAAVFLLLPGSSFGQREHIILMATMPLLASLAARSAGAPGLAAWLRVAAGIAAGIGFAVKPYYALGLAGPLALLWWELGWCRAAATFELWTAVLVAGALGALQLAAFPDFTHTILPLLGRIYLPSRQNWGDLLLCPNAVLLYAALAAYAGLRRSIGGAPVVGDMLAYASLGLFAAFLLQGKGWPYHAYPATVAALLALAAVACQRCRTMFLPMATITAALALGTVAEACFDVHLDLGREAPGLQEAVGNLGPHPKIMSLAPEIAFGHPLVRDVGGHWVGTLMSSWISLEIHRLTGRFDPAGPYGADLAFEDRIMALDIEERRPDAVLANAAHWSDWLASQPAVARALDQYRLAGTFGPIMLFTRKDG